MLALLYDVHGNLPALEAVLEDAQREGAARFLLGGDVAAFGGAPAAVTDRLEGLHDAATWVRGNTERWLADRHDLPEDHVMHAAVLATRADLGEERADRLAALPASAPVPGGVAWHASPVSDMRSFAAADDPSDPELLGGATGGRLVFGHTHLQFVRTGPGGVELVNPGSVGMPLDGDPRAAYALLDPDGLLHLRRVVYDVGAARDAVLGAAGGAPWGAEVAGRLERAAL